MAAFRFNCVVFTLLLQFFISYVTAHRQLEICKVPYESCGPVPPVLPESFTMKATVVDTLGKVFMWKEEYFDSNNERVKLVFLVDGSELNHIVDFRAQEMVTWVNYRPGGSSYVDDPIGDLGCKVKSLTDDDLSSILRFRRRYGDADESRMYSSNQVLNFGGPHVFAFVEKGNSTDPARGMPTYAFKGCVYDKDDDRTMESTYHWTERDKVIPASLVEKMPVKIENKGKIPKDDKDGYDDFEEVHDIVWFDDIEDFPESIFQIPPRMQCSYLKRKGEEKPQFSNFFSARMEVMNLVEDWHGKVVKVTYDWYEEIWYDNDLHLVRLDFVPTDRQGKAAKDALGSRPISAVYDFNTGVVHYTEKTFGKCVMMKIPLEDFLVKPRLSDPEKPELAQISEIFGIDSPAITYKGKYVIRDIATKAWAGPYNRTDAKGKKTEVYREFYVSAEEWHADDDDEEYFSIPIRDTIIALGFEDGQDAKNITEVNFFKFKLSQPHLSSYDISGCLSLYTRKFFYFELPGDNRDAISHHHEAFLDALRQAIKSVADVGTPIRVQELEALFVPAKNVYQVSFSLLDVPPQTGDISLPNKGVDLGTAASNLHASFQGTPLSVTFKYKENKVTIVATKKTLKELQAMSEVFVNMYSPSFQGSEHNDFPNEVVPVKTSYIEQKIMYAPIKEKKQPSGYSSGSLAGLAIAMLIIGTIVGIAAMEFHSRRKHHRDTERIILS